MTEQTPRSSRTWQVVVAATAITVIGGASTAAAWTDNATGAADASSLELSEQRSLTETSDQATLRVAEAMSARWDALASQVGEWTATAVPTIGTAFVKARDLAAAQDVQSASVPSVASPVTPQTPVSQTSPVSPQTAPSAQSPVTPQTPQTPPSAQSPESPQTPSVPSPESPVTPPSVESPVTPESPQTPPSVPSPESPASPESPESPDSDDE
ncbi:hypothetical protein [Ornithinimicrobium cavernae]|uniref:hypothetical protein n=1 Tax=Ornithinimicrobium cavernae TaxID=2666047 RepID=UPI000D699E36|nr:hypothetical protein [Ornithinimicrobium cavernae]